MDDTEKTAETEKTEPAKEELPKLTTTEYMKRRAEITAKLNEVEKATSKAIAVARGEARKSEALLVYAATPGVKEASDRCKSAIEKVRADLARKIERLTRKADNVIAEHRKRRDTKNRAAEQALSEGKEPIESKLEAIYQEQTGIVDAARRVAAAAREKLEAQAPGIRSKNSKAKLNVRVLSKPQDGPAKKDPNKTASKKTAKRDERRAKRAAK